jgi:hypothetical protein
VRLVDFAHTEAATTVDENYLFGFGTLVEMLEDIAREGRSTSHVYENQRYTHTHTQHTTHVHYCAISRPEQDRHARALTHY